MCLVYYCTIIIMTNELEKIPMLIEQLNTLKEHYPNVCDIWLRYIHKKVSKLIDDIHQCENVIDELRSNESITDIDLQTITLLSILFQPNNNQ